MMAMEEDSGNRQPTDRTDLSINRASQLIDRSDSSANGTENSQPENNQSVNRAQDALLLKMVTFLLLMLRSRKVSLSIMM